MLKVEVLKVCASKVSRIWVQVDRSDMTSESAEGVFLL